MTNNIKETMKYTEGLTKEMYDFVSSAVAEAMKDETTAAAVISGVVLLAVNVFRLNPVGFVATTMLPIVIKALYEQYKKNQTIEVQK